MLFAIAYAAFTAPAAPVWASHNKFEFAMEVGGAGFVGEFRQHLKRDGAKLAGLQYDFSLEIPITEYFGVRTNVGSGCVIHSDSKPIEGTILYVGPEAYGRYAWDKSFVKAGVGTGFQHTTMLIWVYGSAYADAFLSYGYRLLDNFYWSTTARYRFSYLKSNIIKEVYNNPTLYPVTGQSKPMPYPEGDNLMSVALTTGLTLTF